MKKSRKNGLSPGTSLVPEAQGVFCECAFVWAGGWLMESMVF